MAAKAKATKKAAAKKAPAKKAKKTAKRYTPEQKADIVAYAKSLGRGGQSKAAKKFNVSPLSVGTWVKAAGGGKAAKPGRKAASPSASKAGNIYKDLARLASDVEVMEAKLAAKKKELGKLAAKLTK